MYCVTVHKLCWPSIKMLYGLISKKNNTINLGFEPIAFSPQYHIIPNRLCNPYILPWQIKIYSVYVYVKVRELQNKKLNILLLYDFSWNFLSKNMFYNTINFVIVIISNVSITSFKVTNIFSDQYKFFKYPTILQNKSINSFKFNDHSGHCLIYRVKMCSLVNYFQYLTP